MSYAAFGENILSSPGSDQSIANMAAIGVDTVALNVWVFQDDQNSTSIGLDFTAPEYSASLPSIQHAIETIHNQGMRVLLKPQIDLRNGIWRGEINPSAAWFGEYKTFINDWATFAESNGVEMLSIGTEYKATEAWDSNWREVAAGVRSRYNGPITYSANWDSYASVGWWDALDYVGIDAYFPLGSQDEPSVAQIESAWLGWANTIQAWRGNRGLEQKVLFTEVGYRSIDGNLNTPWDFNAPGAVDLQEQANAYRGLLNVMVSRPWFDGAFWWNWETNPTAGGPADGGFTPQNKPAEQVLQQFYSGGALPLAPVPKSHTLFSFEPGEYLYTSSPFAAFIASVHNSSSRATHLEYSMEVTQFVEDPNVNHFSWNAEIDFFDRTLEVLTAAIEHGSENYVLQIDVIYDPAMINQSPQLSFLNASIAFATVNGGWSQVDGLALTDGKTNQSITVSVPLSAWPSLVAGGNVMWMYLAINGDWGDGAVTVYYDNLRLIQRDALAADYNGNGVVDAADYSVWRDSLGAVGLNLAADGDADGRVTLDDYEFWKSQFGLTIADLSAGASQFSVPEPTSVTLEACIFLALLWPRHSRTERALSRQVKRPLVGFDLANNRSNYCTGPCGGSTGAPGAGAFTWPAGGAAAGAAPPAGGCG